MGKSKHSFFNLLTGLSLLLIGINTTVSASHRPRVAIIGGGGAGLVTSWLLDETYDVTLFEKNDHLGGHARTLIASAGEEDIFVDLGTQFFTNKGSPTLTRLLEILNIPLHQAELTYAFFRTDKVDTLILTPVHDNRIHWKSFKPVHIEKLILLKYTLDSGRAFLKNKDKTVTVEQFIENLSLPLRFKREFLYPFFASGWGTTAEAIKNFAAYDILSTITDSMSFFRIRPPIWNQVRDGMTSYVNAVEDQLKNVNVKLNANVSTIKKKKSGYTITEKDGSISEFEYLVMATEADDAAYLLRDISEAKEVATLLSRIEYYKTTIAVHSDKRFMPPDPSDWSTVNVRYDGKQSAITMYNHWRSAAPIFKSWIISTHLCPDMIPEPLYSINEYKHPVININYQNVQIALAPLQGKNGLWITGSYTTDVDRHESALLSAINVAKTLDPKSSRLKLLLKY